VVGVLALQGAFALHQRMLASLGVDTIQVRTPVELEQADALVMPGGESSTMSMMLERSGLLEPLCARLGDGMATFGTCAGAILLGREILDGRPDQAPLGAIDVAVRRNGYGRQVDSFEEDLDVVGIDGAPVVGVFIRAPIIERVGDAVEVLAATEGPDGTARPVLCRERTIMISTFHPELSGDPRLHATFLESI
jgi:5'-phosphate synthase pdxT subunit